MAQQAAGFTIGPAMNIGFMTRHLSGSSLYDIMALRNINHDILQGNFDQTGVVGISTIYATGKMMLCNERYDAVKIGVVVGLELCNGMMDTKYADQEAGRRMFNDSINAIIGHMCYENVWRSIPGITLPAAMLTALNAPAVAAPVQQPGAPVVRPAAAGAEPEDQNVTDLRNVQTERNRTFEDLFLVAQILSHFLPHSVIKGTGIVTGQVAALARRGMITENWAFKFLEGIKQELSLEAMDTESSNLMTKKLNFDYRRLAKGHDNLLKNINIHKRTITTQK